MYGGQLAFEGSLWALGLIQDSTTDLYIGLLRKRGEPADEIDDETTMTDIDGAADNKIFEEIDGAYERKLITFNAPEAGPEPEDGYEGDKPAIMTNAEAIEYGPWSDEPHLPEEEDPDVDYDEVIGVFLTDSASGYTSDFLGYEIISMGHQVKEGETLRIPAGKLTFRIN